MHVLTGEQQTSLYNNSALTTDNRTVTVAGARVRAHPWVVHGQNMFAGTSPACWNWTLMAGDSEAETDDPRHGYDAIRGAARPATGCWAANQAASTAVINDPNLALPHGYVWDELGVHVPRPGAMNRDWFYRVVLAASVRQATHAGYTVGASRIATLNGFAPAATGYYVFMYPEFGLQADQSHARPGTALYKPPLYDHWWLQVPAGAGHSVSLDTVTGNSLRIFRDSRIWATQNVDVVVLTVNGLLDSHAAKLEMMGLM